MSKKGVIGFRWQSVKRVVRAAVLLLIVYFSSVVTVAFQFPLWLWLTVEAILRYVPFWLSIPFLVYIGWQFDTVLSLPLGSGLVVLLLLFVSLMLLRTPRLPMLQAVWRVVGFVLFAVLIGSWWWRLDWKSILLQTILYSGLLVMNLYRRHRE